MAEGRETSHAMSAPESHEDAPPVKFPRTPHLIDTGSATRDDLILDAASAAKLFLHPTVVSCEEKVDGANLGISFDDNWGVRLQKRSHWVTSASESQFQGLDRWVEEHRAALARVLGHERILYGEWLFARHTVPYACLPDLLLAFDVFEKNSGRFLSSSKRDALLEGTGISTVRNVARQRSFATLNNILRLVMEEPSSFYDGPMEGVVVRVDDEFGFLARRAKVVHPDFVQALGPSAQHWSKRSLERNGIRPDLYPGSGAGSEIGPEVEEVPAERPAVELCWRRGLVCLCGPAVDEAAERETDNVELSWKARRRDRDGGPHHHITLVSPKEAKQLGKDKQGTMALVRETVRGKDWVDLGLGMVSGPSSSSTGAMAEAAAYKVVVWPAGQSARRSLGLPHCDFHITVGFRSSDVHGVRKDVRTLRGSARPMLGRGSGQVRQPPEVDAEPDDMRQVAALLLEEAELALDNDTSDETCQVALTLLRVAMQWGDGGSSGVVGAELAAGMLTCRARCHGRLGDTEACLRDASAAAVLAPAIAQTHAMRARAFFALDRWREARDAFSEALRLCQVGTDPGSQSGALTQHHALSEEEIQKLRKGVRACERRLLDSGRAEKGKAPAMEAKEGTQDGNNSDSQDPLSLGGKLPHDRGEIHSREDQGTHFGTNPREITTVEMVHRGVVTQVRLPRNFSWVVPRQLAGCSTPKTPAHVAAFRSLGIRLVITLTEEEPLPPSWFTDANRSESPDTAQIRNLFVPTKNYHPPSTDQVDLCLREIVQCVSSGGAVMVHCGGGKGRAGTVLACYLARYGLSPLRLKNGTSDHGESPERGHGVEPAMCGERAVALVRAMRPGSIETVRQEEFLRAYVGEMWERINRQVADDWASCQSDSCTSGVAPTPVDEGRGSGTTACSQEAGSLPPGRFPSIPHLPFSPQVHSDDVQLPAGATSRLVGDVEVVVTEKLDGANCCIHRGLVYARTHGHEATHASFSAVKQLAAGLAHLIPRHLALFGENMAAIHSIEYDALPAPFFLFSAFDCQTHCWLPWSEVSHLAQSLALTPCPTIFHGSFPSLQHLQRFLDREAALPSCVGRRAPREGFVVRVTSAFPDSDFGQSIAKYVRKGHGQTDATWRRTWRPASWVLPPPGNIHCAPSGSTQCPPPGTPESQADRRGDRDDNLGSAPEEKCVGEPAEPEGQMSEGEISGEGVGRRGREEGNEEEMERGGRGRGKREGRGGGGRGGEVGKRAPRFIMLVGLPGSGKSTFAGQLAQAGWVRVCQDEEGSRGVCEDMLGRAMFGKGAFHGARGVVLDRCNVDPAERKGWLRLAGARKGDAVAVHFDVPPFECKARVAARTNHPTIRQGGGGRIVDSFAKSMVAPTVKEGFGTVHVVRTFEEANVLLQCLGASPMPPS